MKRVFAFISFLCVLTVLSVPVFATGDYTVTAEEETGLKALILSLIGDYSPTIVEVTDTDTETGNAITHLEVKNDYVWLASFFMLALVIYCIFRLGGAILNDI